MPNIKITKLLGFWFLIFTSVIFGSYSAYGDDSAKHLRVGGVVSLSGPASVHGESIQQGLLLAAEDLAAEGKKVDLVFEDDGSNSSKTVSAIQNLAAKGINLFIGMTWSFQAESAAPVIQRLAGLGFAPACSSQIAGGPNQAMLFGTNPSTEKIPIIKDWFLSNNIKSADMIYAASSWGSLHEEVLKKAAKEANVTIGEVSTYNYGDEAASIPVLVTKLRRSKPDAVFVTGSKEGSAILIRKMLEQQVKAKLLGTDDFRDAVEAGLIENDLKGLDAYYLTLPISKEFSARFEKRFKKAPYVYADSAYDGLMLLSAAFHATDGTPEKMREYLILNPSYSGFSGPIRFDNNGDVHKSTFRILKLSEK